METQLGELENRLADANESAMRGGKSSSTTSDSRDAPRRRRARSWCGRACGDRCAQAVAE